MAGSKIFQDFVAGTEENHDKLPVSAVDLRISHLHKLEVRDLVRSTKIEGT